MGFNGIWWWLPSGYVKIVFEHGNFIVDLLIKHGDWTVRELEHGPVEIVDDYPWKSHGGSFLGFLWTFTRPGTWIHSTKPGTWFRAQFWPLWDWSTIRIGRILKDETSISGWWFGTFGLFFHNIWDVILPIDELLFFKRGWNHQPDFVYGWKPPIVWFIEGGVCRPTKLTTCTILYHVYLVTQSPGSFQVFIIW